MSGQTETLADLLASTHANTLAKNPQVREITREWLSTSAPLVWVYAASGTGKTTWTGSLFKHPDYRPVHFLGIEPGDTTISEYTENPTLCVRSVFDGEPKQRLAWIYQTLDAAADVECSAIVIEGIAAQYRYMLGAALRTAPNVTGHALQRLCIEPAMRTASIIEAVAELKLTRRARGRSVPIIATINTKETGIDDSRSTVPDWSNNLIEQAMRNADAFMEMRRSPTGVTLLTQQTREDKYRKVRHSVVADAIERQVDLSVPGLLALWATTLRVKSDAVASRLTS